MWEFISKHWSAELVVFILLLLLFLMGFMNMVFQFLLQMRYGPNYKFDSSTAFGKDKCAGKSKCTGKCVDKSADKSVESVESISR
jgi:hypothetical protein